MSGFGGREWRARFEAGLRSQARWSRPRRAAPAFIEGNHAEFLEDGQTQLAWMLAAIRASRRRVDFEMYIVADDDAGRAVRDALVDAARRGVHVRVIFDSIGSADAGHTFFEPIASAGGELAEFNPIAPWRLRASRLGKVQAWQPNTRDHRKLLIADVPATWASRTVPPSESDVESDMPSLASLDADERASLAILGGRNLGDEYLSRPLGAGQWRDCGAVIFGPIIHELGALFDAMWLQATSQTAAENRNVPKLRAPPAGDDAILAIGTRPGFFNLLQWALAHLAWSVERELRVSCAYFIPTGRWVRALRGVVRRGGVCLLLLPKKSDLPIVDAASRHFWGTLLAAGVGIFQHTREVLHEKTLIYDQRLTVIGSSNLDSRSFRLNHELAVIVLGERFAREVVAAHAANVERAEPFTYAMWKQRGILSRLTDWFWALFRRQL